MIAANLTKKNNYDLNAIYQIEFVGANANFVQSVFVLMNLENIKKNETKILSRECNSLIKDSEL